MMMTNREMNRRTFLSRVAVGGAAALSAGAFRAHAAEAARHPNILVILTDDQGWGDVRIHDNDTIVTPVMDRLAAEGAQFDRFYVSPVCAPTRAGFLTGRYYLRTGVTGVTHGEETMRSEERTLAEILRDAGYATGCFGKWHNGAHYPNHPNGQGFDEFFGFCAGHWNNYFDTTLECNGKPVKTEGYINDVVTDAALTFIDAHREQPFFCYVPYNTPHMPLQVPDKYFDPYKEQGLDDSLACVYGMCKSLDDNIGRLLDRLESLGLTDDTIVVFFGDNGPNTDRYNGGMLGRKGSTNEGGVRNSLFIRWPGHIAPGTVVKPIAATIDLLPTLAELANVPIEGNTAAHSSSVHTVHEVHNVHTKLAASAPAVPTHDLDGISLVPLLMGNPKDWPDRMIFSNWKVRGAVRTERYRLVVEKGHYKLYDMIADPGQKTDIADQDTATAARLQKAYDAWYEQMMRESGGPPPIPIGYAEMPVVTLPAPECNLHGGVKYQGDKGWANDWVTNWTSTDDSVTWDIDVVRGGTYALSLLYTCPEQDVGAELVLEIGDQRATATIDEAYNPDPIPSPDRVPRHEVYEKVWKERPAGHVNLPTGRATLTVRATKIPGTEALDLKAVRVERIG